MTFEVVLTDRAEAERRLRLRLVGRKSFARAGLPMVRRIRPSYSRFGE